MKKRSLLLLPFALAALSACESGGNNSKPYVAPAKDINSMADFLKMVTDNPYNNSSEKTPVRYSLNVDLDFKNASTQYSIKDVELIGNKHRIKNFTVTDANYAGFFSKVKNCIFSDLTITNAYVAGSYAGAFVGHADIAIFKNIKVGEFVEVGDGVGDQVGGIIGYAENAEIKYCENNAAVYGVNNVGGVVGHSFNSNIISCTNNGDVSGDYDGEGVGGICGTYTNEWTFEAREDTFDSNKNFGNVTATECEDVGGLIGKHHPVVKQRGSRYPKVTISKSTNSGVIEGKNHVGGIAGSGACDLCDTIFTSCVNQGSVIGKNYVGGIAGYTKDFSINLPYTTGDEIKQVTFTKCSTKLNESEDNFVKGEMYVGGIAGNGTSFSNCTNNINVITVESLFSDVSSFFPDEYQHSIGGIVGFGYAYFDLAEFSATVCTNNGKITGISSESPYNLASSLAGICGYSYGGKFMKCINNGELNAAQCVGGLIGTLEPRQETYITESNSNGNIIVNRCAGGLIGDIEASNEHFSSIRIAKSHVDIEDAHVYGTTPSPESEPYKFVLGGLIGRANSSTDEDEYYGEQGKGITVLGNYTVDFNYRSPDDAQNMTVGNVIGYTKESSSHIKLVQYKVEEAETVATITRTGSI